MRADADLPGLLSYTVPTLMDQFGFPCRCASMGNFDPLLRSRCHRLQLCIQQFPSAPAEFTRQPENQTDVPSHSGLSRKSGSTDSTIAVRGYVHELCPDPGLPARPTRHRFQARPHRHRTCASCPTATAYRSPHGLLLFLFLSVSLCSPSPVGGQSPSIWRPLTSRLGASAIWGNMRARPGTLVFSLPSPKGRFFARGPALLLGRPSGFGPGKASSTPWAVLGHRIPMLSTLSASKAISSEDRQRLLTFPGSPGRREDHRPIRTA